MQRSSFVFDDITRVANGALSTLAGLKGEFEALVRQQLERLLSEMDWIPRDEFDAVKAMAAKARAEQEALAARVAALEAALAAGTRDPAPHRRPPTRPTPAEPDTDAD